MILQNYLICKRGHLIMGRKNKEKKKSKKCYQTSTMNTINNGENNTTGNNTNNAENENYNNIKNNNDQTEHIPYKSTSLRISIIITLIPVLVNILFNLFYSKYSSYSERLIKAETQLAVLEENYAKITNDINKLSSSVEELSSNVNALSDKVSYIQGQLNNQVSYFSYHTDKNPFDESYDIETFSVNNAIRLGKPHNDNVNNLTNEYLLLSYQNDIQEVYIWGKLNEYNNWSGNCTINVYENDKLILITDGFYDNGELTSFKQVVPFINNAGTKVWGISDRIYNGTYSSGDTYTYYYEDDYTKNFNIDSVVKEDIITVDNFKEITETCLEGHYHGNISNGFYNDTTGNSYIVKYAQDGTVKTLYVGNFIDGKWNDFTGYAWEIAREENTTYMYYSGCVSNGSFEDENLKFELLYTIENVHEKLDERNWNIELNWYQ